MLEFVQVSENVFIHPKEIKSYSIVGEKNKYKIFLKTSEGDFLLPAQFKTKQKVFEFLQDFFNIKTIEIPSENF